jgi:FlaA1/EpsC-like NDP-sugar epimerase
MNRHSLFVLIDPVVFLMIALLSVFLTSGSWANGILYAFVFYGPIIAFSFQQRLWRYASIDDVWDYLKVIGPFFVLIPVLWFLDYLDVTYLLIGALAIPYLFLSRFGLRFFDTAKSVKDAPRVLIYGAGEAGSRVYKELSSRKDVVGFFDDDSAKAVLRLHGKKIYTSDVLEVLHAQSIDEVVLAIPTLSNKQLLEKIQLLAKAKVALSVLPSFEEIDPKNYSLTPRAIKIEDVLGRKEVSLDLDGLSHFVQGKRIMVTGAGGSIGSELVRQLSMYDVNELILVDQYENGLFAIGQELMHAKAKIQLRVCSVVDKQSLQALFEETQPQIVYHAAAHKHVPLMEDAPWQAMQNNIIGSYHVFECANEIGSEHVVVISTDKAVNPTNVMGATKRIVERVMQTMSLQSNTVFSAVRFGNVLGSNGSVIPIFEQQIAKGGPVRVTHPEIKRYFMTIPEAVQLVLETSLYASSGDIFVLDMGEPILIKDLAESMIRLAGFEPHEDIKIEYTGLRPGEKMFEELVIDADHMKKTANDKIVVETAPIEPVDLTKILNQSYLKELLQATIQPAKEGH